MNIAFYTAGRLGNALFRYFAIVLLIIKSKHQYNYIGCNGNFRTFKKVNNCEFVKYITKPETLPKSNLIMVDYYQIENVYTDNKSDIIKYINDHKFEHSIQTQIDNKKYDLHQLTDINVPINIYDIVIHLRLDDFVNINEYIKIDKLVDLLNNMGLDPINKIGIVCNKVNTEFEKIYIAQLMHWFNNHNLAVSIETNDVITDFHIMKNAKTLVCSRSTLSWCAAFLSTTISKCYMPNYPILKNRPYQTFKTPIKNTVYYNI